MEFTRDQRKEAIQALPEAAREFVYSDEFSTQLNQIGKDNGLLIDKIGILDDEIFLAVCGLKPVANFIDNITKSLGIGSAAAQKIGDDVNRTIFLKIREKMGEPGEMKTNNPAPVAAPTPEVAPPTPAEVSMPEVPAKEDILAEIENPTPTVHPISAADQTLPGPAIPRQVFPEPAKDPVSKEFVAGKLTESVAMPTQKAVPTPNPAPAPAPAQKKYSVDPYREPIE
ncbi:MAG TPA: hypothetical protein VFT82_01920 [Candidatus Paceibacterota bacterium]|nr:hypothetical protein [Candidatus Paceibacterota bacterium]